MVPGTRPRFLGQPSFHTFCPVDPLNVLGLVKSHVRMFSSGAHCEHAQQISTRSVGCLGPRGFSRTPAFSEVRHPVGQEVSDGKCGDTPWGDRVRKGPGPQPGSGSLSVSLEMLPSCGPLLPPSTSARCHPAPRHGAWLPAGTDSV